MKDYAGMSQDELARVLRALESNSIAHSADDPLQRLVNELQVYRVKFEMQNRELRETRRQLEQSRDRYTDTYDAAPLGYLTLDAKGIIREINLTAATMLGGARTTHIGVPFSVYIDKNNSARFFGHLRHCREAETASSMEMRLARRSGVPLDVEIHTLPAHDQKKTNGPAYNITLVDISQRVQTQEELRLTKAAFDRCNEAVAICDNRNYILHVNRRFRDITGYAEVEVIGKNAHLIGSPSDKPSDTSWQEIVDAGSWQGEIRGRRKNGAYYPLWLSVVAIHDAQGFVSHYIYVFSDVDRTGAADRIRALAHYDALTKLPNRSLLHERLDHALLMAQRNNSNVAVILLDIDGFASLNDGFGTTVGDRLLQRASERIVRCLRAGDTVSRVGSNEFAIVLADIRCMRQLMRIVEKVMAQANQTHNLDGAMIDMTLRAGTSVYPQDGNDGKTLLKHARLAMQRAKLKGRGEYAFFNPDLIEDARRGLQLENELRHAIERDEFTLVYQPQLAAASPHVVGAEAFIRWQHPERGVLPPAEFLPTAEQCGLIQAIGDWALRKVCSQRREWNDMGLRAMPVSLNISRHQLEDGFAQRVTEALREQALEPYELFIELNENALAGEDEKILRQLDRLKTAGVRIVLDNFGAGRSSLMLLRRLPVSKLKIDRSLIHALPGSMDDMAFVRTIIDLANNLSLDVGIVGVETPEQLEYVHNQGCETVQGFYLGQPVTAAEFVKLIQ